MKLAVLLMSLPMPASALGLQARSGQCSDHWGCGDSTETRDWCDGFSCHPISELSHRNAHCPKPTGEFSPPKKVAYAFYLAGKLSSGYADSVLVNAYRIRELQTRPADIIVFHDNLPPRYLAKMRYFNVSLKKITHPFSTKAGGSYYKGSYNKFLTFQLQEWDRVLYMDADAIILRNPEPLLFETPRCGLAMPEAHWLGHPFFMSGLMLVEPKHVQETSAAVLEALNDPEEQRYNKEHTLSLLQSTRKYDMDVVNRRSIAKDVMMLPPYALVILGPQNPSTQGFAEAPFVFHASGPKFWMTDGPEAPDRQPYWRLWKSTKAKLDKIRF